MGQLRWVTRITSALSSHLSLDDLQTIILSALVSPDGLEYSRAIFFAVDRATTCLCGKVAVGPNSRREAQLLRRELREEEAYLEHMADASTATLEDDTARDSLQILRDSKFWIHLSQMVESADEASRRVASVRKPIVTATEEKETFLQWAARRKRPTLVTELVDQCPPVDEALAGLLARPTVVIPLRTPKGLRGLILADRRYSSGVQISDADLEDLEWFAVQAALAIENAELIEDLGNAYNQLRELDNLKSNFLSIVSHELRTPMTAVLGFVDLLLGEKVGDLQPPQRSILVRASKNANHLLQILNDLLEVSEVQAEGIRDVHVRPVDPLVVLFNTLPRLEQRRRGQNVEIEPVVHESVPRIICEPRALERILFHLLDNAIKFSRPNDRIQVDFSCHGERLHIAVRDSGIGIDPDRLQQIFESFYQVDNRLTRSYEGLGLGLTVTRLLLTSTQGEIHVESQPGHGSTFTISYPIAP